MKVVCIIQARRGSKRLRNKILKPLAGKTILEHVIQRALLIDGVDQVVCASVDDEYNLPVLEVAKKTGAAAFAGSEHDVLDRYYSAAVKYNADAVMRITADCPLLDPFVCAEAVAIVRDGKADYGAASGSWPHGMDCEIFTFDWLEKAHRQATLAEDREHVTLWMKGHADINRLTVEPSLVGLRYENRWVLDYPEDYEFLIALAKIAPEGKLPLRWQEIVAILDENSGLREINRHCSNQWEKATQKIIQTVNEQR